MKCHALLLGVGLSAMALLQGCSWLVSKPALPQVTTSQQGLYALKAWKLEGRMAAKRGKEGWNANFVWEHDGVQERVRIFGPFSQGAVSIIVQSDLVYINEGDGKVTTSRAPDGWLKDRLGFVVPLRSLRYWVLGLPAPDSEYTVKQNAEGKMVGFVQGGWNLAFEGFESVGSWPLPKKTTIRCDEAELRLVADDWILNN